MKTCRSITKCIEQVHKDPLQPILFAGSLDAPVCFSGATWARTRFAMVSRSSEQQGKLVREGILRAHNGQGQGAKYSRTQLEKRSIMPC